MTIGVVHAPIFARICRGTASVKRLRSATEANEYQREWFARVKEEVARGSPLAIVNADVPQGPVACVFLVRDGVAFTPPVTGGILESITRTTVMELPEGELSVPVVEREVDRTELYIADEAFLRGTATEIAPILSVDRSLLSDGKIGRITARLEEVYERIVRGRNRNIRARCSRSMLQGFCRRVLHSGAPGSSRADFPQQALGRDNPPRRQPWRATTVQPDLSGGCRALSGFRHRRLTVALMSGGDLLRHARDESRPPTKGQLSLARVLAAKGLRVR